MTTKKGGKSFLKRSSFFYAAKMKPARIGVITRSGDTKIFGIFKPLKNIHTILKKNQKNIFFKQE
jgi:hypothetical protein